MNHFGVSSLVFCLTSQVIPKPLIVLQGTCFMTIKTGNHHGHIIRLLSMVWREFPVAFLLKQMLLAQSRTSILAQEYELFSCVSLSLIWPCLRAPAVPSSCQQLCFEPLWEQTSHLPSIPLSPMPVSRLPSIAHLWPFQLTLPFSDFKLPLFLELGPYIWCWILLSGCFIFIIHKLLPNIFISEKTFVRSR